MNREIRPDGRCADKAPLTSSLGFNGLLTYANSCRNTPVASKARPGARSTSYLPPCSLLPCKDPVCGDVSALFAKLPQTLTPKTSAHTFQDFPFQRLGLRLGARCSPTRQGNRTSGPEARWVVARSSGPTQPCRARHWIRVSLPPTLFCRVGPDSRRNPRYVRPTPARLQCRPPLRLWPTFPDPPARLLMEVPPSWHPTCTQSLSHTACPDDTSWDRNCPPCRRENEHTHESALPQPGLPLNTNCPMSGLRVRELERGVDVVAWARIHARGRRPRA